MKANELMIGDWFFNKNTGKYQQVHSHFFGQVSRQVNEETDLDLGLWFNIFPITLTPEILEKNGFVFVEGWWEIPRLPNGHGYVAIAFDPDEKGRPTNTIYDLDVSRKESGSADLHLNYVHELQHALRLCGIDKDIIV